MDNKTMEFLDKNLTQQQKIEMLTNSDFMGDDVLYYIEENFDEMLCQKEPLELAYMVANPEFNPNDTFFYFNGYGNLVSVENFFVAINDYWYPELLEENEESIENFDFIVDLLEEMDEI